MCQTQKVSEGHSSPIGMTALDRHEKRYVKIVSIVKDKWDNEQYVGLRLSDGQKKIFYPGQLIDLH